MVKFRSVIIVVLALAAVLWLNLGSVAEAKPKSPQTYTGEQIAQIQDYVSQINATRERFPELAKLIQERDWTYVRNFIHGPLGDLRATMSNLSRSLLPEAQPVARKAAKVVFDNLVAIDQAATKGSYDVAIRNYAETLRDLDTFLKLIPNA